MKPTPEGFDHRLALKLIELARTTDLTAPEIAARAGWKLGVAKPKASLVASFLGRSLRGNPRWNRFMRDREMAHWIAGRAGHVGMDGILAGCVAVFGADRAPSRSALGRFLHDVLNCRGKVPLPARIARDLRVARLLRAEGLDLTLDQRVALVEARLGVECRMSRTHLGRFCKQNGIPLPGHCTPWDAEVRFFIRCSHRRWASRQVTLDELRAEAVLRFGEARVPSRSRLHAFLIRLQAGAEVRRGCTAWWDRHPDVAADALRLVWGRSLDKLLDQLRALHEPAKVPPRTSLHRFLVAKRFGVPRITLRPHNG